MYIFHGRSEVSLHIDTTAHFSSWYAANSAHNSKIDIIGTRFFLPMLVSYM